MSTGYRFQNLGLPGVPSKRAVSCWQTAMWNKQRSQDVSRNKWADSRCSPNCITERHCILHCATSRKVTGSIRGGVIGIFHWHNPSGRTMDLGLTQPLTEMSTRNISLGGWGGGEGGRCLRLTILPPSCAERLQIWEPVPKADNLTTFMCRTSSNLGASGSWEPQGLSKDCFTFSLTVFDVFQNSEGFKIIFAQD